MSSHEKEGKTKENKKENNSCPSSKPPLAPLRNVTNAAAVAAPGSKNPNSTHVKKIARKPPLFPGPPTSSDKVKRNISNESRISEGADSLEEPREVIIYGRKEQVERRGSKVSDGADSLGEPAAFALYDGDVTLGSDGAISTGVKSLGEPGNFAMYSGSDLMSTPDLTPDHEPPTANKRMSWLTRESRTHHQDVKVPGTAPTARRQSKIAHGTAGQGGGIKKIRGAAPHLRSSVVTSKAAAAKLKGEAKTPPRSLKRKTWAPGHAAVSRLPSLRGESRKDDNILHQKRRPFGRSPPRAMGKGGGGKTERPERRFSYPPAVPQTVEPSPAPFLDDSGHRRVMSDTNAFGDSMSSVDAFMNRAGHRASDRRESGASHDNDRRRLFAVSQPGAYHVPSSADLPEERREPRWSASRTPMIPMPEDSADQIDPESLNEMRPTNGHSREVPSSTMAKEGEDKPWYRKIRFKIIAAILLLIVVAVAVAVPLSLSRGSDESVSPNQSPTLQPTTDNSETYQRVRQIALEISTEDSLDTVGSPQNKALNWIVNVNTLFLQPELDYLSQRILLQRYALVTVYYAMGRENWLIPGTEVCYWNGVGCGPNKQTVPYVTSIALDEIRVVENEFTGFLPPELGFLTSIDTLRLSYNNITIFSMPVLSELTNLRDLGMSMNAIRGTIPEDINALTNLVALNLTSNQISGNIPAGLYDLSSLETVILSTNKLNGTISSSISNLVALRDFRADYNLLTGTLPAEVGSLALLKNLILTTNDLQGDIAVDFPLLRSIEALSLEGNRFTGQIPTEVGSLPLLRELSLSSNGLLSTIPSELGNLSNLVDLRMQLCSLSGSIPTELGKLLKLAKLDLSDNKLSSQIPTELGNLVNMVDMDLQMNQLTGSVPTEFEKLTKAVIISLDGNRMSGTVSNDICSLMNGSLRTLVVDCTVTCACCDFGEC